MKPEKMIKSAGGILLAMCLTVPAAFTAQYDLKQMTPEVQRALSGRQARYQELQGLKAQGAVGENNRGYVAAIQETPAAKSLVSAENRDRKTIYQAIAVQNQLGATGLAVIETVFAEVHHENSRSGDYVQNATGQWLKK